MPCPAPGPRGDGQRGEVSGLADAGTLHGSSAGLTRMGLLCLRRPGQSLWEAELQCLPLWCAPTAGRQKQPSTRQSVQAGSGVSSREPGHSHCSLHAAVCLNGRALTVPGPSLIILGVYVSATENRGLPEVFTLSTHTLRAPAQDNRKKTDSVASRLFACVRDIPWHVCSHSRKDAESFLPAGPGAGPGPWFARVADLKKGRTARGHTASGPELGRPEPVASVAQALSSVHAAGAAAVVGRTLRRTR